MRVIQCNVMHLVEGKERGSFVRRESVEQRRKDMPGTRAAKHQQASGQVRAGRLVRRECSSFEELTFCSFEGYNG